MAIDIDKMKEKLNRIKDGGKSNSDSLNWFKAEEDKTYSVRFLPDADGSGDPFAEVYWHYCNKTLGDSFVCNKKTHGEDCPVCELGSKLWQDSFYEDDDGEEKQDAEIAEVAKDLFATQRFYSNVFVREEAEKGVQIYGYPKSVAESLLMMITDPDYGDFTDVKEGHDMKIVASRNGEQSYLTTSVNIKPKPSPLAESDDMIDELLEEAPNVIECQKRYDLEKVESLVDDYIKVLEEEHEGTVKYDDSDDDEEDLPDVDDAFAQLSDG